MRLLIALIALSTAANAASFSADIFVQMVFPETNNYILDFIHGEVTPPFAESSGNATAESTGGGFTFDPPAITMFAGFPLSGSADPIGFAHANAFVTVAIRLSNPGDTDITVPV